MPQLVALFQERLADLVYSLLAYFEKKSRLMRSPCCLCVRESNPLY
jgi:hypothetical protein